MNKILDEQLNICNELLNNLKQYEFTTEEINRITSNELYIEALNKDTEKQYSLICLMLYRYMVYSGVVVPPSIKFALQSNGKMLVWLDSLKLVIIPFMKKNNILSIDSKV